MTEIFVMLGLIFLVYNFIALSILRNAKNKTLLFMAVIISDCTVIGFTLIIILLTIQIPKI